MTELAQVLEALAGRGLPVAEVYAKRGRARGVEETPAGRSVSYHREEGWAVRAGDDRRSLFAAGSGRPDPAGPGGLWPEADGEALVLPDPQALDPVPAPPWHEPPDLDAPLIGEREAVGLLSTLGEELRAQLRDDLPGARIVTVRLIDGASEWEIASRVGGQRGVAASGRSRSALLRVEAALPEEPGVRAAVELAARAARVFDPRAVGQRLADRLAVAARGRAPERDRAELVLAPPVAARLLAGLLPLFVGSRGAEAARRLEDRQGRFASAAVTVIDDGRFPAGVLAAPVDGEGVPTAEVRLVEEGVYRRPLLPWWEARPVRGRPESGRRGKDRPRPSGCVRRPGWRDLPRPGASHLYLAADPDGAPGDLLAGVARGYYLLDADGPAVVDPVAGRLTLPVVGFALAPGSKGGRATSPVAGAVLEGGIGSFLRGVRAVGRDLAFFPLAGGMVGAPTVVATGLEIRAR